MSDDKEQQLLTITDLAVKLKLAERTILRMVHKGEIPCLKIGSQWRFIPNQIDAWLAGRAGNTETGHDSEKTDRLTSLIETSPDRVPLSRLTGRDLIIPDLIPGTKQEVLEQLAVPLIDSGIVTDGKLFLSKLREREEMLSTAVGNGVAVPHTRNPGENPVTRPAMVIGVCPGGTAFDSPDGKPTYLFVLLAVGTDVAHLQLAARINRFLLGQGVVEKIIDAGTSGDIYEIFMQEDTIYRTSEEGA